VSVTSSPATWNWGVVIVRISSGPNSWFICTDTSEEATRPSYDSIAPFGRPVVPEVYRIAAGSCIDSGPPGASGPGTDATASSRPTASGCGSGWVAPATTRGSPPLTSLSNGRSRSSTTTAATSASVARKVTSSAASRKLIGTATARKCWTASRATAKSGPFSIRTRTRSPAATPASRSQAASRSERSCSWAQVTVPPS